MYSIAFVLPYPGAAVCRYAGPPREEERGDLSRDRQCCAVLLWKCSCFVRGGAWRIETYRPIEKYSIRESVLAEGDIDIT